VTRVALPLEDYALIGDCETAALVGRDGAIDWVCLPRFDAGACFAALLGTPDHGRWLLAPAGPVRAVRRRYRDRTLVLETELETAEGVVRLVDCMTPRHQNPDVVRLVCGVRGRVPMRMELAVRFGYGRLVPRVRPLDDARGLTVIGGVDAVCLRTPVACHARDDDVVVAAFAVAADERVPFTLTWLPANAAAPPAADPFRGVAETEARWREWCARGRYDGEWQEAVERSLLTVKALTYQPTGGIVAAPTTSLPEHPGGASNWDYRYCWLRDATFSLYALTLAGYVDEAKAWRDWLLRAVAGRPRDLQVLYGIGGERRLPEIELPWLPGYAGSTPVRVGNAAAGQLQLDVYGELVDAMHAARRHGMDPDAEAWRVQQALLGYLETAWREPDASIWEVRGPRRQFTFSKVMAWVAFDRAVKGVERFGLDGPVARWRGLRDEIHAEVCRRGFDRGRNAFVQSLDGDRLDGSLLLIPQVGFLPGTDPRVRGTIEAIARDLTVDGFVRRYAREDARTLDGLPDGDATFLPCSFWLVDALALLGRVDAARALFTRLLDVRNDVGLLAEEYDPASGRLLGNFPQALSHVALINSARNLSRRGGPAEDRAG
jgi:GH15 family glucan-1,4-alpha-glucosidase